MEADVRLAASDAIAMLEEPVATKHGVRMPACEKLSEEAEQLCFPFHAFPVHPAHGIVVTITVIIATLRPRDFVAHEQHGYSAAEEKEGRCVLHLPTTKSIHAGVISFSLPPAVPAIIIVGAVVVPFAVRLVVLAVVRNHVAKSESVVAGDEIQACRRTPVPVQIRRSLDSIGDLADQSVVALDEAPDRVAVLTIPFRPSSISGE